MNPSQVVDEVKKKLSTASSHLQEELKKLRTGRAHPGMLDGVTIEAYGSSMPLKAAATITAPEAQLLQVTPFDPSNLQAISTAIRDDKSLGLNPADDGRVVRVSIPPLTEETRQQLVKILNQKVEECMISMRQARHEGMRLSEQAEKDKDISRDERGRLDKQIDEAMASKKAEVDQIAASKEKEIMTL